MAGPETVVVDASVAVKCFNEEQHSRSARQVRIDHIAGDVRIAAPSLIIWEVCNGLMYNPDFGVEAVRQVAEDLRDLALTLLEPDPALLADGITLAFQRGMTVYDASDAGAAGFLGTFTYSADEKAMRKTPKNLVRHISTCPEARESRSIGEQTLKP